MAAAVNSETKGGRYASEAELSPRRLLPPFQRAVQVGASTCMIGYQTY
jgi:hypothetical protein